MKEFSGIPIHFPGYIPVGRNSIGEVGVEESAHAVEDDGPPEKETVDREWNFSVTHVVLLITIFRNISK